MKFKDDHEELLFLKRIVLGLGTCGGRETAEDSYEFDYCWDMIEEYVDADNYGRL